MDKGLIPGVWQLKYTLVNKLGPEAFGGRMLSAYADPITGKTRHLHDVNGGIRNGYFVTKQITTFKPLESKQHEIEVDWLVGHPLVGIQQDQTKLDEKWHAKREKNPRFTLVNLDHEDVVDLKEEDYIDKLIGAISQDQGPKAMDAEKLQIILCKLNLEYIEEKFITNQPLRLTKLKARLKNFVRANYENAQKVNHILDHMEEAKFVFEITELIRLGIVTKSGGMYMYQGNPLGISHESLILHFKNNPEFYADLVGEMYKRLK